MFIHLQESRAPSRVTVTWGEKRHDSEHPPFLLPPALYAEHVVIRCGIPLWSHGVSCPGCVPSRLLVAPQPSLCWGRVRSRKGLDAGQALLSNNKNIPVLSGLFSAQIQNTASYQKIDTVLAKTSTPIYHRHLSFENLG